MTETRTGLPTGIKFYSFYEPSGYGEAGRRYLLALKESGIPVTWTPLVPKKHQGLWYAPFEGTAIGDRQLDSICNLKISYDTVIIHTVPEYFPVIRALESGVRIFGYTVWETTAIPAGWKVLLNSVEGLLVPCRWNKEIFEKGGVTVPISIVPHIHCPQNDAVSSREKSTKAPFTFYGINTWTERKSCWNTVRAFLNEFNSSDNVRLILKTSEMALNNPRGFLASRILRQRHVKTRKVLQAIMSEYSNPAEVQLITSNLNNGDISELHSKSDCYVSLTRTEGWGMGAFDACIHGKPVIMTGFGGQLDYLTPEDSYLVDYKLVPVVDRNPSYSADQYWAEPSVEHASRLIRSVFENREEAAARGERSRLSVLSKFGPDLVTKIMVQAVT